MTRYDTRLADPDARAVHSAIEAAFRAVSQKGIAARISHTKISVKRIAERSTSEPEGVEFWASRTNIATGIAGQVSVAWWTAISGRRYVRVVGRIVTPETGYLVNASKLTTRPAVWHVFPDRVYRRRAGKANDLVAVCGCGAVGTEKALGWGGACCGPCFDYQEEHGQLPPQRPALLPMPTACRAVAGSADGRWVAAACLGQVMLWDLERGAEPVKTFAEKCETNLRPQVALSPAGDWLASVGTISDGLRVINTRNEKYPVVLQMRGPSAVAFRPKIEGPRVSSSPTLFDDLPKDAEPVPESLYFVLAGSVMVASPPDARAREVALSESAHSGPVVFSRNGTRLAVCTGHQVRVHENGGKTLATLPFPHTAPYHVAQTLPRPASAWFDFSVDGGQVAVGFGAALAVYHAVTGQCRFDDGKLPDAVTGVAFDPGGKWLYVGRHDGTLVAYRTDILSDERSVVFRWSLGPIHALAMCGDSLLTACDEGVQIWPVAKLLEGM